MYLESAQRRTPVVWAPLPFDIIEPGEWRDVAPPAATATTGQSYLTAMIAPTAWQATKTAHWVIDDQGVGFWNVQPQGKCEFFRSVEHPVNSLDDVGHAIDLIRQEHRCAVLIGGRVCESARRQQENDPGFRIRRRGIAGHADGTGTIEDVPRRWICVDIDNWVMPDDADLSTDPAGVIGTAVAQLLPEAFHGVRAFWQLSSSCGLKGRIQSARVLLVGRANRQCRAEMDDAGMGARLRSGAA